MTGRPKRIMELTQAQLEHITSLYEEGASDVEVKAYIRKEIGKLSNDLWERWMLEEPVFSETIKNGRAMSNAWWEREGRKALRDKDFSYTGWYMNMKNRFGWADKQETAVSVGAEKLTKEQRDAIIATAANAKG